MDKLDRILDNKNKGSNMKCKNCGCEMEGESEEMPLDKSGINDKLLSELIENVGGDGIGQKLEILIAKKGKKKPEMEM